MSKRSRGALCMTFVFCFKIFLINSRPEFKIREGSELLRRRQPVSSEKPFRYKESLREIVNGRILNLEYDVTLLPSTQILDNMESIESIECSDVTMQISVSSDLEIQILMERFEMNSVLVAGKEWGCSHDGHGNPEYIHRRVLNKYIHGKQIILLTKDCSPLDAFSDHKIEMWSSEGKPPIHKYEFDSGRQGNIMTEGINVNTSHENSVRTDTSRRSVFDIPVQAEYGPPSTTPSFTREGTINLLNQNNNKISLSWNIFIQSSFYFRIEGSVKLVGMCGIFPCFIPKLVITYSKIWVRVRPTLRLNVLVDIQSATSTQSNFQLVPAFPIPGAGVGVQVGGVGFQLGFFFEAVGRASLGVDGLFQMRAGVEVSTDVTSGFEYSPSSGFVPTTVIGPIAPTKTFTWGGRVTAVLKVGVVPILSLNLIVKGMISKLGFSAGLSFQVGPQFFLQGELKLGVGKLALDALPASKTNQCFNVHQQSICSTKHMAEAFLTVGAELGTCELEFGLGFSRTLDFLSILPTLSIAKCLFVGCYPVTAPTASSPPPSSEMPSDDPGYINPVLDLAIFSTYRQAYIPKQSYVPSFIPSNPVPCLPGSTCPSSINDCAYGYQAPGFACASGCAMSYGNPATCVQKSCCKAIVRAPLNAVHKIAGSGASFVSQGLELTGGNYVQIECNSGYVLSGKNLGFQQLGYVAVGSKINILTCFARWGSCGGWPMGSDYTPCVAGRVSSGPLPTSNTPGKIADNRCEFVQLIPGDGSWMLDGERICTPVSCGKYNQPANGMVTPATERKLNEFVTITCNTGYELSGDQYTATPVCQANGNFTSGKFCAPKTCAALPAPMNGQIFPPQSVATQQSIFVQCVSGYETTTKANLVCVNGEYVGQQPTCSKVSCGSLRVQNGMVRPTEPISFNSSVFVKCNTGFYLQDGTALCTADKVFSRVLSCTPCANCVQGTKVYINCTSDADTVCKPVVCAAIAPVNGSVSSPFAMVGENVTISCNAGFQFSDNGSTSPLCKENSLFETGKSCIRLCDPGNYLASNSGEFFLKDPLKICAMSEMIKTYASL